MFSFVLLASLGFLLSVNADVRVSGIFTNNMVIQIPYPEKDVPPSKIYGLGFLNETIYITGSAGFPGPFKLTPNKSTNGSEYGNWSVNLIPNVNDPSFPGPYTIEVVSKLTSDPSTITGNVTINDTYFGEVFLCSGQSNMGITVAQCSNYANEQGYSASLANIRMYKVPWSESNSTAQNITSWPGSNGWVVAAPSSIGYFSCVCWESGRILTQYLMNTSSTGKKPYVGLIESDQGGTTVYLWHAGIVGVACNLTHQLPNTGQAADLGPAYYNYPGALYNGMINPLCMNGGGISIRQAIWYQGEADSGENDYYMSQAYICSLHGLIYSWRDCFNQTLMPFITIQLPNGMVYPYSNDDMCMASNTEGNHDYSGLNVGWSGIQEAQFEVYNLNQRTGLVSCMDQGQDTLHYKHKLDVAKRTELWMRYLSFNDDEKMTLFHAENGVNPDDSKPYVYGDNDYNYDVNHPNPPTFIDAYKLSGSDLDVYFEVNNTGPNGLHLQDGYNCSTFVDKYGTVTVCTDNCTMYQCCELGAVNTVKFRLEGWYYYMKGGKKTLGLLNWFPGNITKFIDNGVGNKTTVMARVVLPEVGGVNWPGTGDQLLYYEALAVRQIEVSTSNACTLSNSYGIPISKGGPFNIQVRQSN